jgi:hypothetical protein
MKRLGKSFGSAEPQEPYPLPCLNLITLITYLFFLLLFACLACLCASLCLHTLGPDATKYLTIVVVKKSTLTFCR